MELATGDVEALMRAATDGDVEHVTKLLDDGCDLHSRDMDDQTALFHAATAGKVDVVRLLLERDDDHTLVNLARTDGWTPLFAACAGGHGDVLDELFNHGADEHTRAQEGLTVLHVVSMNGHANLVESLLHRGISVDVTDDDNWTALHYASANGHGDIVCMLAPQASPGVQYSSNMTTPLHLACCNGHADVVATLLEQGADIRCHTRMESDEMEEEMTWSWTTALHLACEIGHIKIVNLLLDKGADPDDWNGHCLRPLHVASKKGRVDVVEALLGANADVSATAEMYSGSDRENFSRLVNEGNCDLVPEASYWESRKTALHFASEYGHVNVIEVLLREGANTETGEWHPLHSACIGGQVEVVKFWMDRGVDVNELHGRMRMSALHLASKHGHQKVAAHLINHGANIDAFNLEKKTPLFLACEEGNIGAVEMLIDRGANPNITDEKQISPVCAASSRGHASIVDVLVGHRVDVNLADKSSKTALHHMCQRGHAGTVKLLLEADQNPNAEDKFGDTPLHYASALGYKQVVETLLEYGAKVDVHDMEGNTPLSYASGEGHLEVVRVLCQTPVSQKNLKAALQSASKNGHEEILRLLLQPGVDAAEALYPACRMGHLGLLQLLLNHGVDVNAQDESGRTALHWASEVRGLYNNRNRLVRSLAREFEERDKIDKEHDKIEKTGFKMEGRKVKCWKVVRVKVAEILLENHANPNVQDVNGRTPLHNACVWGDKAGVKMLLKHYANISLEDKEGMTALHLAAKHHHSEIVSTLLSGNARVDTRNHRGKTPLSECLNWGSNKSLRGVLETVYELMSRGAVYECSVEDYQPAPEMIKIQRSPPIPVSSSIPLFPTTVPIRNPISTRTVIEPSALAKIIPVCVNYWSSEQQNKKRHLTKVPPEILGLGPKNVQVYLRHIGTSNENELILRRKVCVVGSTEAGKTSLVKSITKMTSEPADDSTVGVDLFDLKFSIDDASDGVVKKKNHEITFWDFAGQDVYHVAHTLFFSKHTLYFLCVDVEAFGGVVESARKCTDNGEAEALMNGFVREHVWRWFRLIFSRQPDAEFVLIATKADAFGDNGEMTSQRQLRGLKVKLFKILSDYQKSYKEEMGREIESLSTSSVADPGTNDQDTRIKDLTRLQAQLAESLPSSWISVSILDANSVGRARSSIESVVMYSNRSFLMPGKYRRLLAKVKERRDTEQPLQDRVARCFVPVSKLRDDIMQAMKDLTEDDYEAILETLHVLGDVLWYAQDGLQVLGDTVILDAELLIKFIREIVCHDTSKIPRSVPYIDSVLEDVQSSGKVAHDLLATFSSWELLKYPDQMLQFKELLQHFRLAYPADGKKMQADSHLIVPTYWFVNNTQVDLATLKPLMAKLTCDADASKATHYHWEYNFHFDFVETVFEQFVVRSYCVFEKPNIDGHCIESAANEEYAVRIALGTRGSGKQKRQVIRLEVVAVGPDSEELASEVLHEVHVAIEDVLRGYPGLCVTREAFADERVRIDEVVDRLKKAKPARRAVLVRQYRWLPRFLIPDKEGSTTQNFQSQSRQESLRNELKQFCKLLMQKDAKDQEEHQKTREAVQKQHEETREAGQKQHEETRAMNRNLHVEQGNHRDLPALWMVERIDKPKPKLLLWVLSEVSGRCFHPPIEIKVSSPLLVKHGEHLQTGLSVFANAIPDSVPLLGDAILAAVERVKTKTQCAVRVHGVLADLELSGNGRVITSENGKLSPAKSYDLLRSLVAQFTQESTGAPESIPIRDITNLECANLPNGCYQWAHLEEHNYRGNTPYIQPVKAPMAQDPTTSMSMLSPTSTSESSVTRNKYYLCDFVIEGFSDKKNERQVYCEWKIMDPKQAAALNRGKTIQNPHESLQQQSLGLQAFELSNVDSVAQLRTYELSVTLKRPSRHLKKMRSDRIIGCGSVKLTDVLASDAEQQFACDRIKIPLTVKRQSVVVYCKLSTFASP